MAGRAERSVTRVPAFWDASALVPACMRGREKIHRNTWSAITAAALAVNDFVVITNAAGDPIIASQGKGFHHPNDLLILKIKPLRSCTWCRLSM